MQLSESRPEPIHADNGREERVYFRFDSRTHCSAQDGIRLLLPMVWQFSLENRALGLLRNVSKRTLIVIPADDESSSNWLSQLMTNPRPTGLGSTHTPYRLYDSSDQITIRRHIKEIEYSSIDVLIVSWWGEGNSSDRALQKLVREIEISKSKVKIVILWEYWDENAAKNLEYLKKQYLSRPAYLKWNQRPVVYFYGRAISQMQKVNLKRSIDLVRDTLGDPILIADKRKTKYCDYFDVLQPYLPFASTNGLGDSDSKDLREKYRYLKENQCIGITSLGILPGLDDCHIGKENCTQVGRDRGLLYTNLWESAIANDPTWIVITSFNEWHEGTEIEPSREYSNLFLEITRKYSLLWKKESTTN